MPHLSDEKSRNRFLSGTYLVLTIHWAIITLCSMLPFWSRNLRKSLQDKSETFAIMGVYLGVIVSITACFGLHRIVPWNIGVQALFTIAWTLVISTVTAASQSYGAMFIFGTLTFVSMFISLVSCVNRWNVLSRTSLVLIFASVVSSHSLFYRYSKESSELVLVSFGLCVISLVYLLANTVSIMARSQLKLEPDESIFGAIALHLDPVVRAAEWISARYLNCLR